MYVISHTASSLPFSSSSRFLVVVLCLLLLLSVVVVLVLCLHLLKLLMHLLLAEGLSHPQKGWSLTDLASFLSMQPPLTVSSRLELPPGHE